MPPKIPIIKATTKKVSNRKVNRIKLIYFLTTTLMKILLKPFTLTPSDPSYSFFSSFIPLRSSSVPSLFFFFFLFPYVCDYRTIRTLLFFFSTNASTRRFAPAGQTDNAIYTRNRDKGTKVC